MYRKIEEEYGRSVASGSFGSQDDKEKLVGLLLADDPDTTPDDSIKVRLYFESTGTLEGLAEWHATTSGM